MFLNSQLMNDVQESYNQTLQQRQQSNRRSNIIKFQAKTKEELQQEIKPLSRIQQKEMEIQKKLLESQIQQKDELVESLILFDSESSQQEVKQQTIPLTNNQKSQQHTKPQGIINIKQQIILQNNQQYKKNLGQNESTYGQDLEFEIQKFSIIGNNHNEYYEPGQNLNQDNLLPKLQKQNKKIKFIQTKYQVCRQQQNCMQEDQFIIQKQIIKQKENIIQNNDHNQELQDIIIQEEDNELLYQQQKEQEIRKELKQQHDKIQMNSIHNHFEILDQQNNNQQIQQVPQEQPIQICPYPKPLISIEIPHDKKHFLLNPAPKGGMIQCTIKRDRSGMCRFYPKYHFHLSNGFIYLMSAKKRACNNTSNYIISMSRDDFDKGNNFIGKVRSNFLGTEFILYDAGQNPNKTQDLSKVRQQLGIVQYENTIIGYKGPRRIVVLLPNLDEREQIYIFKPTNSKDGIIKEYENNNRDHIVKYVNVPPKWKNQKQSYILNFYDRIDKTSVKNFQLIVENKDDNILLQFGRVGDDIFNLDFQYPITPLQAFQIALTSFDYKIACK